ncbi:MAG TPA: hypothetical protein VLB46_14705 [Pyrinomonadaceae bacterium]|nr:hypothetical protein [Pyrinomonadaceae bacterium]
MWEYKVAVDSWKFQTHEEAQAEIQQAMQRLNAEGSQGWELTAVQQIQLANRLTAFVYFYKRQRV